MFSHCNRKFKPYKTWFLHPNQSFTNRRLEFGICPNDNCQKEMLRLVETRIADNQKFSPIIISPKAIEKIIKKCKPEIEYIDSDVQKKRTKPFGLLYGTNKIIHNTKGKIIGIRQRACDYYGNNEIVKFIPLNF